MQALEGNRFKFAHLTKAMLKSIEQVYLKLHPLVSFVEKHSCDNP